MIQHIAKGVQSASIPLVTASTIPVGLAVIVESTYQGFCSGFGIEQYADVRVNGLMDLAPLVVNAAIFTYLAKTSVSPATVGLDGVHDFSAKAGSELSRSQVIYAFITKRMPTSDTTDELLDKKRPLARVVGTLLNVIQKATGGISCTIKTGSTTIGIVVGTGIGAAEVAVGWIPGYAIGSVCRYGKNWL